MHHTNERSRKHFCIELTHTRVSVCPISDRAETIAAVAVTLSSSLNGTSTRTVRITDCNQRNTRLETPLDCLPVLILNLSCRGHLSSKCSESWKLLNSSAVFFLAGFNANNFIISKVASKEATLREINTKPVLHQISVRSDSRNKPTLL